MQRNEVIAIFEQENKKIVISNHKTVMPGIAK